MQYYGAHRLLTSCISELRWSLEECYDENNIRAHKVRFLVYIADAAVVGESPNVKSKVELKSKVFNDFLNCF